MSNKYERLSKQSSRDLLSKIDRVTQDSSQLTTAIRVQRVLETACPGAGTDIGTWMTVDLPLWKELGFLNDSNSDIVNGYPWWTTSVCECELCPLAAVDTELDQWFGLQFDFGPANSFMWTDQRQRYEYWLVERCHYVRTHPDGPWPIPLPTPPCRKEVNE